MAETQREPVPRVDSGELDTALAFLSFARHCVLKKADGLSDEQLRSVLVDSGTSVLGLVQHLAEAERYWFGYHLVGAAWDAGRDTAWPSPPTAPQPMCCGTTGRQSRTATARSVPSARDARSAVGRADAWSRARGKAGAAAGAGAGATAASGVGGT